MRAAQDRRNALAGIDILRKVCNHPDLLQRAKWEGAPDYGNPARSGKLTVAMKARRPARALILCTSPANFSLDLLPKYANLCSAAHTYPNIVVARQPERS